MLRLFRFSATWNRTASSEKRDYRSSADKIRQAICAFANDLPDRRLTGIVFIGQNDDGTCAGIDVGDELLKTLGGLRSDGQILPFPVSRAVGATTGKGRWTHLDPGRASARNGNAGGGTPAR